MYEMELDGVVEVADGYQQANLAQVLLFGKGGLDAGVDHTVVSGGVSSDSAGSRWLTVKVVGPWLLLEIYEQTFLEQREYDRTALV
jgi:hypothetical protein